MRPVGDSAPRYWFRAKRLGYGWGLPLTWEGWCALLTLWALLGAGGVVFRWWAVAPATAIYLGWVFLLAGMFLAICSRTGEPLTRGKVEENEAIEAAE